MPQEYLIDDIFNEIIDEVNYIRVYSTIILNNNSK